MIQVVEGEEEEMVRTHMPHPQLLTLCLSVKRMTWMIMTTGKLSPELPLPLPFQFQELPGPKHMPPPDSPPIAYFHLFFTGLILTLTVTESNRHAQQVISSKVGYVPALLMNWTRITMHKMKGFPACILNMGIIKKPTTASYWSNLRSQATAWSGKMFTRKCFSHKPQRTRL
jgi:hypothetical protein